ncbi:putative cytochrome P450 6a21 [Lasioglossum baleicum]|uniref:putative cytochrome P450 6a21 n=1 Tax=Lasioglossum baleicum TaxID=434251 RepID=UPI003FCE827B
MSPTQFKDPRCCCPSLLPKLSPSIEPLNTGSRFANLQAKLGLITILRNHKVDVCEETTIPYEFDKRALLLQPKHGLYLKVTKIE